MSILDTLQRLAREILGTDAPSTAPRDFSKVQEKIVPERGERKSKRYTSTPNQLADVEVLPEYEFILRAIQAGCPALFVTGKAGTGKSTLIHWLRSKLDSCAVVAPTGVAAAAIQGDTIHSFFGLPSRLIDPEEKHPLGAKARLVMENVKCLIIDEVSMVLPNIVDIMSNILRGARNSRSPFGGVPVVFVGDLLQLPPIVNSGEESVYFSHRYRTPYFFSAEIFREQQIVPVVLTKVRRQADVEFIEALNQIRLNLDSRDAVAFFNRRCFRDKPGGSGRGTYLVPTNQSARTINMREMQSLPGEAQLFEARVEGKVAANQWKLPVPDRLELKVGAKIIFLKNRKPEWINGDVGTVVGLDEDHIRVRKDATENVLLVGRETWQKYKYVYDYETRRVDAEVVGTFEQFPLTLGWAITIHKSQGLSLDALTLDLGRGAFAEGQTYVALSRARTIEGITLSRPIAMRDVRASPAVLDFYRELDVAR
jgi:ATP-dependent DNA helicase PIF1